jgi:hypothetical protein
LTGCISELVQNRSFEYYEFPSQREASPSKGMNPLFAWTPVERGGAKVKAAVALL